MLRSIRAEVCLSFDVCLAVRMFVLSGPFMNEGVSSYLMIWICCFCASVSDVWVKWSVVVGSRALDDSERKIWMCWLVLGSHRTKFRVGTSDRPICCLVLHPLFWWQDVHLKCFFFSFAFSYSIFFPLVAILCVGVHFEFSLTTLTTMPNKCYKHTNR
jgi:hypothetical protein